MKICLVCRRCFEDSALSCAEENHEPLAEMRIGNCDVIANYRLEFLHESTASGEIYRAFNSILKKTHLIKIIAPEHFDEHSRKQFLSETRALSAIIHPNVARVYESGILPDGSLYVVTEFLTAQTLRDCLTKVGAPSEVTALTISRQTAEGLEAIHALDILHRNIRPENIILMSDAENRFLVKIQNMDFGGITQKIINSKGEQNLHYLKYFSPEQCAVSEVDVQTDVYSLGIVLYETLAGRAPFDAPDADVLINKQINEPPPPVKINNFDLRMLLTHTLSDALQKQVRLRLKSANAMARRLRHIEQLATHSSTPPPVMAHPATIDKTAIVFSPPPKIEKPVTAKVEIVIETPPIIEIPLLLEETKVAENLTLNAEQPTIEKSPAIENQLNFEVRTVVEKPFLTESQPVVENKTAADSTLFENREVEEIESPVKDYSTTKLPPLESIIGKPLPENIKITDITPIFSLKPRFSGIHETSEPVLIDWQQPDDVPTITQALGKRKKEIADAVFAPNFAVEKYSVTELGEIDAPFDSTVKTDEPDEKYTERDVFSYDDSETSRNFDGKRILLTGAGIAVLIILAVGGTFLLRQFQSDDAAKQTAAQSVPEDNQPQKPAALDKVSKTVKPETVAENNPSINDDNAAPPVLPDFQPRESSEKTVAPISPVRNKKQPVKENSAKREQILPAKILSNEIFDKKGEVKTSSPDDKTAVKNLDKKGNRIEFLTRPRVVKNPKF